MESYSIYKAVAFRFIRGGIASAFATMATIVGTVSYNQGIATFSDVKQLSAVLVVSGMVGFISGIVLAGDKYFRSSTDSQLG